MGVRGADEIVDADVRQSAITSHSIGIPELIYLFGSLPPEAGTDEYRYAIVNENLLGLASESGRVWRFKTLRRLYHLRPDSLLFRAMRDLWNDDADSQPLLAAACALATDTVFRASATVVTGTGPEDQVTSADFAAAIDAVYPGAYKANTLEKAAANAYRSWEQSGHLQTAEKGSKRRKLATCGPANVAYALLLGHLEGHRGEALFDTIWTSVLDQPRSGLYDLAFAASQRGMLEYRNAGGVVEVGFRELLRPMEGELL